MIDTVTAADIRHWIAANCPCAECKRRGTDTKIRQEAGE